MQAGPELMSWVSYVFIHIDYSGLSRLPEAPALRVVGTGSIACLCVCVSVYTGISQKHIQMSRNCLQVLPVAMAQSSSDDSTSAFFRATLC